MEKVGKCVNENKVLVVVGGIVVAGACYYLSKQTIKKSLFERLGGAPAIAAVVDGMYAKIWTDEKLIPFFTKTDKLAQKDSQRRFLTYATGGTTEWTGKSMKDAHRHRGIERNHYDLIKGHIVATLKELSVPEDLIGEVGAILDTLIGDVCTGY